MSFFYPVYFQTTHFSVFANNSKEFITSQHWLETEGRQPSIEFCSRRNWNASIISCWVRFGDVHCTEMELRRATFLERGRVRLNLKQLWPEQETVCCNTAEYLVIVALFKIMKPNYVKYLDRVQFALIHHKLQIWAF